MKITLELPADKAEEIVEAICQSYDYQAKIIQEDGSEIDNPVTKGAFAKNIVKGFIKEKYVAYKLKDIEVQRKSMIETALSEVEGIS